MSKYELQRIAYENSGITYEESQEYKTHPIIITKSKSMYERLGYDNGCKLLSELFYNNVFNDKHDIQFLNIFASSTKNEAIDNQYRFLVETFGGPSLYKKKKNSKYTRLVGRHANYNGINSKTANRWIYHMINAINEHPNLQQTTKSTTQTSTSTATTISETESQNENESHEKTEIDITKDILIKYFKYTAHYIVASMCYMRDDQVRTYLRIF